MQQFLRAATAVVFLLCVTLAQACAAETGAQRMAQMSVDALFLVESRNNQG